MGRRTDLARAAVLALAALFAAAEARADDDAMGGPMAGSGGSRRVVHDPAYFRERVLPLVARHCIACHDAADADNRSRNRFTAPDARGVFTDEAVQANYTNLVRFLDAATPERSTALLKLVAVANGGIDHDGGKADDEHFPRDLVDAKGPFVAWIFGASATAAPPIAVTAPVPRTVTLGEALPLDASLSFDPDGGEVGVAWEVVDAPQNARAAVEDPSAKRTRIVPDREGPWILRCRPSDGRLSGWPARVRFAVTAPKTADDAPTASAAPVAVDSAERRATRALFLDLFGRTPNEAELARWAAYPYEDRVDRMLATPDAWRTWFDEEAFYFLLIDQFRPVSDRLAAVPEKMAKGEITFSDAHREFALSAEFNARNPGNDTFVTVVLEQLLGIDVQKEPRLLDAGKKMYDGQVARIFDTKGDNQSDVVRIALAQPTCVDLFLKRMESRYLGEALPKSDHDATLSLLAADAGLFRTVLREWLVSPRYRGAARAPKPKTDRQFIRSLFVDLLGRPPAYEEFRNMRNALQAIADPRPLRGVLAKVILDSGAVLAPRGTLSAGTAAGAAAPPPATPRPGATAAAVIDQPEDQVTDLFHRLLGRDPDRKELAAFAAVLREPGTTWRVAALALLTSPQYQYY